jgi:hypothetical protein
MFAKHIFLRRLIRSLEDRHSMVPGRVIQLRLQTFLEKQKGVVSVSVEENPCKPQGFLGAEIQDHILNFHSFASSSHLLIIDLLGILPTAETHWNLSFLRYERSNNPRDAFVDLNGSAIWNHLRFRRSHLLHSPPRKSCPYIS